MNITLPLARSANLHFVTPTLAVGGDISTLDRELSARQVEELAELGITHVIDCRQEWDDAALFADALPHLAYLHHGMDDAGQKVPAAWFEAAARWVAAAGPDAVVLTHCHMGINRGPSLGFALLLSQGWDAVDAIAAIREARPIANVWYAEDALVWHHGRRGSDPALDISRVEAWRRHNPLDVVRIIRAVRMEELAS